MTVIQKNGRVIVLNVDAVDWIDILIGGDEFYVKMKCGTTIKADSVSM